MPCTPLLFPRSPTYSLDGCLSSIVLHTDCACKESTLGCVFQLGGFEYPSVDESGVAIRVVCSPYTPSYLGKKGKVVRERPSSEDALEGGVKRRRDGGWHLSTLWVAHPQSSEEIAAPLTGKQAQKRGREGDKHQNLQLFLPAPLLKHAPRGCAGQAARPWA